MRRSLTPSEHNAKCSLIGGSAFEMQVVFGYYILDFVIPSKMLIIEIDGASHNAQAEYDKRRDAFCEKYGLSVLRILNNAANTAGMQAGKYPLIDGFESKWAAAIEGAAKEQAHTEMLVALSAVPEAPERTARRVAGIKAVKAMPREWSGKQILAAMDKVCPPKGKRKKKKNRPQIDMSIEAKIAANRRKQMDNNARKSKKQKAQSKTSSNNKDKPLLSKFAAGPPSSREIREAHQAMIRASRLVGAA